MAPIKTRFRGAAGMLLAALFLSACSEPGADTAQQPPPPEVSVAIVLSQQVKDWDEYSGRIEAVESVHLRPRVAGYLEQVHFREGSLVEKGELLFSIDEREYRAQLAVAEADVNRARSRVALAGTELGRSESLVAARAVSRGEVESRAGELAQAEADLQAAQARARQAQLNLEFTRIQAPISGRIGAALVKPGNLVAPGETLLATLVSVDPVHVVFDGDERAYLRYQAMSRNGTREASREQAGSVQVALVNEQGFPHQGEMDFVDNVINPGTGTIRGRALLANPEGVFTPGLFARVRLMGASPAPALLIHDQAVMTDQDRKYVWVLGEGSVALRRDVSLGDSVDGLRIVLEGLEEGDRVVVNGVRKIFFPGQPVAPREVPMDQPAQLSFAAQTGG